MCTGFQRPLLKMHGPRVEWLGQGRPMILSVSVQGKPWAATRSRGPLAPAISGLDIQCWSVVKWSVVPAGRAMRSSDQQGVSERKALLARSRN